MAIQAISTDLDGNTHGAGWLQANPLVKVYVGSWKVTTFGDQAWPDHDCDEDHPPIHCTPYALDASEKVFTKGIGIHRNGDRRGCGATTVAINSKVFAG